MNIKCSFCQTPYAIGRLEKLDALQHMYANNLNHYDAHCPRCRRATPVLRQKLEMTFPNWREALKDLEKELTAHPQPAAPLPKPETDSAPEAESKPEQSPATDKPAKEKPAARKPSAQKPAAKKPDTAKKATAKKSA